MLVYLTPFKSRTLIKSAKLNSSRSRSQKKVRPTTSPLSPPSSYFRPRTSVSQRHGRCTAASSYICFELIPFFLTYHAGEPRLDKPHLIVVDEAHHLYAMQRLDPILNEYASGKLILLSDASQVK